MVLTTRAPHALAALAVSLVACGSRTVATDAATDTGSDAIDAMVVPQVITNVDLLVEIDNSGSMRDDQAGLLVQLGSMMQALAQPPLASLHVGVIDQDLGTHGSSVPGCVDSDHGDDGLLNPIRNGRALSQHEPWTSDPPTFPRPRDCTDPNEFPSFITFESGAVDPTCTTPACQQDIVTFTHDFRCNAGLYVNGCGLEQQLDAIHRALVIHDPSASPGNTDPNAGFLRDDAILAILLLSDEEDGSVRDCTYAAGLGCSDATDVFNAASTSWSSMNLNLRDYLYQPGSAQDPTWTIDRYFDPHNPNAGWLRTHANHPERVIFAAITGVPIPGDGPASDWQDANGNVNWDMLLGTPSGDPNDFTHRDSTRSIDTMSAEGPVSMRQANPDPTCPERVVPACRRQGQMYSPTYCTTDQQYFAWPGRRIVEVARRFDQAPLCNGQPCHNGLVGSICAIDYGAFVQAFVQRVRERMGAG